MQQLVLAAWGSAASFRGTDKRGGANGARIRLEPQRGWEVNAGVDEVLTALEGIQREFNDSQSGKKVSLADLIVLAGGAAIEKAAQDAGHDVTVPFTAGRTDASQEQTDAETFSVLEPRADGFRNYLRDGEKLSPETLLVERAYMLELSAPEMTVLVGGLRALGANAGGASHGVLTDRAGALTNDFFVNLLAPGTEWKASESTENVYEIRDLAQRRRPVDRHRGRPRLRIELAAPGDRRGLRRRRRPGEVRPGLRAGVGQGDEPRQVRPGLTGHCATKTVLPGTPGRTVRPSGPSPHPDGMRLCPPSGRTMTLDARSGGWPASLGEA